MLRGHACAPARYAAALAALPPTLPGLPVLAGCLLALPAQVRGRARLRPRAKVILSPNSSPRPSPTPTPTPTPYPYPYQVPTTQSQKASRPGLLRPG